MEVKLDKRYPLDVEPARAWAVLRDVTATAECMPGASITEQIDATHYKGSVKVKIGPANAAINGTIEVLSLDAQARRVELLGKGADRTGSQASMKLIATVEPGEGPGSSVLVGNAEVNVTGKLAQFGGRLMVQVADLLLAQFADNFRATAAALPEAGAEAATTGTPAATFVEPVAGDGSTVAAAMVAGADAGSAIGAGLAAPAGAAATGMAAGPVVSNAASVAADAGSAEPTSAVAPDPDLAPSRSAAPASPSAAPPRTPVAAPPRQTEVDGLALLWMMVKNGLARLFGRR